VAVDAEGNVYVADTGNDTIRKVTAAGFVTTVAGTAGSQGLADGIGAAAQFSNPHALAMGPSGTIYVADGFRIRSITSVGEVATLAGGPSGFADGMGSVARFAFTRGLVVDSMENIYVLDTSSNNRLRKVTKGGEVTTLVRWVADGPFSRTLWGLALDSAGNFEVADTEGHSIKQITAGAKTLDLAGREGVAGLLDGTGAQALFNSPMAGTVDAQGNLYVADTENHVIRVVSPAGVVVTLAGSAGQQGDVNGTGSEARFSGPKGVALDASGNVYVADTGNQTIRKISPVGVVTTLSGSSGNSGNANGNSSTARFSSPTGLALNASGSTLYVADTGNNTIRHVSTTSGAVTLVAGSAGIAGSVDAIGAAAQFSRPEGIVRDRDGSLYVADRDNHTIRRVTAAGIVTTFAGKSGIAGNTDAVGTDAAFTSPTSITSDLVGNLYVSEANGGRIRILSATAQVSTLQSEADPLPFSGPVGLAAVARNGVPSAPFPALRLYVIEQTNHRIRLFVSPLSVRTLAGSAEDAGAVDGIGFLAQFNRPEAISVDAGGNLFVADTGSHTIRHVRVDGTVTTLAGVAGSAGIENGTRSSARFRSPAGVAVAADGTVYIADTGNHSIRKITGAGVVTDFAGLPGTGGSLDGTASAARFRSPRGLAIEGNGTIYVADTGNNTIRMISTAGMVTTVAGFGGASGTTDGAGSSARFRSPHGIAIDSGGNLFISDTQNNTIRIMNSLGVVETIAGQAGGMAGAVDGAGVQARFWSPSGLALGKQGEVFLADRGNHTIRVMMADGHVRTLGGSPGTMGGSEGLGAAALCASPYAISVSSSGIVFLADTNNNRVLMGVAGGAPDTAPLVSLVLPSEVGVRSATLNGRVNPNGAPTSVRFEYGTTPDCELSLEVATTPNDDSRFYDVTGLLVELGAGTLYYYRLAASSRNGTARTLTRTFTTSTNPPVVSLAPPRMVRDTSAILAGSVNPNGGVTTAYFEYGLTIDYGKVAAVELSVNDNLTTQDVSVVIEDLLADRGYFYRLVATSANGTAKTTTGAFRTLYTPLRAYDVTNRGTNSAVLEGLVDPNGAATSVQFQYGLTSSYGSVVEIEPLAPTYKTAVQTFIENLLPDTTYHFRIVSSSTLGEFATESKIFRTLKDYPEYTITELGTLGGATSFAYGINNAGQVVGGSYGRGRYHAFVNTDGMMADLGSFDDSQSHAYGINVKGEVVGTSRITLGVSHAYRHSNGEMLDLGTLGGIQSSGFAINDSGQVTGTSSLTEESRSHAFLFSGGVMTDLGTLGGNYSVGRGINRHGHLTGVSRIAGDQPIFRAFQYSGGALIDIGTLGGASSQGYGINDSGTIVGEADLPDFRGSRAFIYEDSSMRSLGDLGSVSAATAINNEGQVVGVFDFQNSFLYTEGQMFDLSLLVGSHRKTRIEVSVEGSGNSINDWGQIAAIIAQKAVLLNPVQPFEKFTVEPNAIVRTTRFVKGMAYNRFTTTTRSAGMGTVVALVDGTVGNGTRGEYGLNRKVVVTLGSSDSVPPASDAVEVTGTEDDQYVLQVSYDEVAANTQFGAEGSSVLGLFDNGAWKPAVAGNNGGTAVFAGDRPYNPGSDFQLGRYGVDTTANRVWAVVNGEGRFGVMGASLPPASGYASWAAAFGLPPTADASRDTDMDGVVDLLEFAFNLDPKVRSVDIIGKSDGGSGLPWIGFGDGIEPRRLTVVFVRRTGPMSDGLTYQAEFASALDGPWEVSTLPVVVNPIDSSWERVVVEDSAQTPASPVRFGRVKVAIRP
jgi:probable HAF family extracellular repeat protein